MFSELYNSTCFSFLQTLYVCSFLTHCFLELIVVRFDETDKEKKNIPMFLQSVPYNTANIIMLESFISHKIKLLPERDEKEQERKAEEDKEK